MTTRKKCNTQIGRNLGLSEWKEKDIPQIFLKSLLCLRYYYSLLEKKKNQYQNKTNKNINQIGQQPKVPDGEKWVVKAEEINQAEAVQGSLPSIYFHPSQKSFLFCSVILVLLICRGKVIQVALSFGELHLVHRYVCSLCSFGWPRNP